VLGTASGHGTFSSSRGGPGCRGTASAHMSAHGGFSVQLPNLLTVCPNILSCWQTPALLSELHKLWEDTFWSLAQVLLFAFVLYFYVLLWSLVIKQKSLSLIMSFCLSDVKVDPSVAVSWLRGKQGKRLTEDAEFHVCKGEKREGEDQQLFCTGKVVLTTNHLPKGSRHKCCPCIHSQSH